MKSFTKISTVALLMASLTLTACGQDVPSDKNRVPGPQSSNSAETNPSPTATVPTAAPVATAVPKATDSTKAPLPAPGEEGGITTADSKVLTEYLEKNPLRIDVDYALKNQSDVASIEKVFPKADFDIKEGVRTGLSLYQDLTNLQDFYTARDTKNDFNIILGYADKMTAEAVEAAKKDIQEHGKYTGILTADSTGSVGTTPDGVNLKFSEIPESYWNSPAISTVYDKQYGNLIRIIGKRTIAVHVESGEPVEIQQTYNIDVVPSGEKDWLVTNLAWSVESAKVIK
jgi:hypothetical protein